MGRWNQLVVAALAAAAVTLPARPAPA